jgi:hypothetical protein
MASFNPGCLEGADGACLVSLTIPKAIRKVAVKKYGVGINSPGRW